MSFMFNPHPYDDPRAVNRIEAPESVKKGILCSSAAAASRVVADAASRKGPVAIAVDGYITAPLLPFARALGTQCANAKLPCEIVEDDLLLGEKAIERIAREHLPDDTEADPVLLYGRVYKGGYQGLQDARRIEALKARISDFRKNGNGLLIVYGNGILTQSGLFDIRIFLDMTPKRAVLNIKSGAAGNLGTSGRDTHVQMLRRAYYIDFEAAGHLRGELMRAGEIDYYGACDSFDDMRLASLDTVLGVFNALANYPLRCRPVYIEGVWGGFYIKRLRHLPDSMRNCAWVFDMIPLEVSVAVDMDGLEIEFPFFTFVQNVGARLMGEKAATKFGGYFPVRLNYDDTFHASGNMSIQVHPDEKYVHENNADFGRQDESYYIVATAQDAKTYIGFRQDADVEEFIRQVKRSEKQGVAIKHDDFVYSEPSAPGKQFMLPAGTIHASGRNQVILEIGSLTVGSYTYKMYDYMRKDLDGKPRPIHSIHGDNVLRRDFKEDWVKDNLIQQRRAVREGDGFTEYIVGEHDMLYFSLRNAVFEKRYEDDTKDRFHALVLVDGEKVLIRSKDDPRRFFVQEYLDMVVVPADFGPYEVINQGVGTVTIHKTLLKEGFEED